MLEPLQEKPCQHSQVCFGIESVPGGRLVVEICLVLLAQGGVGVVGRLITLARQQCLENSLGVKHFALVRSCLANVVVSRNRLGHLQ